MEAMQVLVSCMPTLTLCPEKQNNGAVFLDFSLPVSPHEIMR